MKLKAIGVFVVMSVMLLGAGCATENLSGKWDLEAQNGKVTPVTIQNFGNGSYYLHGNTPLDGIYTRQNDKFVCTKPDDPRLMGFVWRIQDKNTLILTAQPSMWVAQERYIGDQLTRR